MYYDPNRALSKILEDSKDLFPIEHECQACNNTFSFTGLDDFKIASYSFAAKPYTALAWDCPACGNGRQFSEHLGMDEDMPEEFKRVKKLVLANKSFSTPKAAEVVKVARKIDWTIVLLSLNLIFLITLFFFVM